VGQLYFSSAILSSLSINNKLLCHFFVVNKRHPKSQDFGIFLSLLYYVVDILSVGGGLLIKGSSQGDCRSMGL
jgi:hypothetical protein